MSKKSCEYCSNIRGYSNTGYWCAIDKSDVEEDGYCNCFEEEE